VKHTASVRRCERIKETKAGTNPWRGWNSQVGKGRGRIQLPLGLEFGSCGNDKTETAFTDLLLLLLSLPTT